MGVAVKSHIRLGRGIGELFAHNIVWAIARETGEIKPLSVTQYCYREKRGTLDGYLVRLGQVQTEACAAEIRARAMSCN